MKKALGILSVLVLITVMMISCNAEQKLDDTVGVSFNVSSSRDLDVRNQPFEPVNSEMLTWYYHGEKKTDTEFIIGQSGTDYWTRISTGNALADTYVTFSQGQWSFEIKAVRTEENGTMTQVYYGRTNANVLLTKENRTISISVSPFVEGVNGTLELSNVYIAPLNSSAKVVPNKLYINGEPIDITESNIEDGKAYKVDYEGGKAINYRYNVAPGTYTVEVKRVGEDAGVVLASASKTVVVYSGLTTTIYGSVKEDTTSGRFDINDDFVINTKEDLILFSKLVNEVGMNFSGKTVKLAANIDLAGVDWKPVGQTGATQFQGVFDGQGYTISNMTVNNPSQSTNVSSGFFGWLENTSGVVVKNVKFDNANVTGSHYVGVVAGYLSGSILTCEVTNSTVTGIEMNEDANGDKVGAIVGYINAGIVDGNKVFSCTIKANRDACGVTGAIAAGTTLTHNTVKDTNIYYITNKNYESAGQIVSGRTGFVPDETNTATNVTVNINKLVTSSDELKTVLNEVNEVNDGDIITLSNDIALTEPLTISKSVTLEGNGSYTISGYPVYVKPDKNVTFKKVNFATPDNESDNASSFYAERLTGKVVFEECTFINPQWECIQITPMDGAEIIVNNCTFIADGKGTYAQENGTKVERLLHIQNTAASGKYTAIITNNRFVGVDLCRNAVIDVDDIEAFKNVTCGGNTFANHDDTPISTLSDGMIYINIKGLYDAANVATDTYAQFVQTPAAELHH